jgi:asparagine synthase (glutamine-hydrolysing)
MCAFSTACWIAADGLAGAKRKGQSMSVQFGRWNLDGSPVAQDYLARVAALIGGYAPDSASSYTRGSLSILYRAFHTTKESRTEIQPYVLSSGAVLTWDGRLDNRRELIEAIGADVDPESADVFIVAAAYERWQEACLPKLLGDWALSAWNPSSETLLLAKDFIGTRSLYYHLGDQQCTWSTLLDPFILCGPKTLAVDEEYVAGWFSYFPAAHLSPFRGIHSVPPASFVSIHNRCATVRSYWHFDPSKRLRYHTDAEYEAHFRFVFDQAVYRRLRSDAPVLAELSGGLDSSSIVCTADKLLANNAVSAPAVDTISYFDDSEITWNEKPFFASVEQFRGRTGFHIDGSRHRPFPAECSKHLFFATPGSLLDHTEISQQICEHVKSRGARVLLSGVGGDEALGGAPIPLPELADLLTRGQLASFARQSFAWALSQRKPLHQLWAQTIAAFLPLGSNRRPKHLGPPEWLEPSFVKRHILSLHGYYRPLRLCGPLPSFQYNLQTLEALSRQIACHNVPSPHYEKRFPFLDRDLWEFVLAVPREQLLRPHERRSLMRRALIGTIPEEIRNRRRKAFVSRGPFTTVLPDWFARKESLEHLVSSSMGIVNAQAFALAMDKARHGQVESAMSLFRTIFIESWLSQLLASPQSRVSALPSREPLIGSHETRIGTVAVGT